MRKKIEVNILLPSVFMEFELPNADFVCKEIIQYDNSGLSTFDASELTYQQFFEDVVFKNVPCIIKNITKEWKASQKWLNNNKPDLDYLEEKYGHTKVIIYNCSDRYFNSQKCEDGTLSEYITYWRNKESNNALYYLKDWHLKLQCKNDNFYEVPIYFASDWLNEYFTQCSDDDYRFVYMGLKGTWTPLHTDVFTSYSWSVNVCGTKKWTLFPPGEENYLRDKFNNLPYDITDVSHSRKSFEIIQNQGEAIFVPSGWYHQVWNLEDTISINHNWVNGCNIFTMWKSLKQNLEDIEKEIQDCINMDNFEEHCQIMLHTLFGMNFDKFFDFLKFIAQKRLNMLGDTSKDTSKRVLFHNHFIGTNHMIFDLKQIKQVLKDFLNYGNVQKTDHYLNGQYLLNEIVQTLQNISTYV